MKKIELGQMISILANVGVIAGIVFLGVELQQNTASVQGATYQAMSDGASQQYSDASHDHALMALLSRVYTGETLADFTSPENTALYFYYFALAQRLENTYRQERAGIVDEQVFESYGWNDVILNTQHFREYWDFIGRNRSASSEFNQFLEERIGLGSSE